MCESTDGFAEIALATLLIVATSACSDPPSPPPDAEPVPDARDTSEPTETLDTGDISDTRDAGDVREVEDASDAALDTGVDSTDAGDTDAGLAEIHLASTRALVSDDFSTAQHCASCHSNSASADAMRDDQGNPVGFYDLWQASMMANAARDPFWRATVSAEVEASPGAEAAIEDKCLNCHSPMAYTAKRDRGEGRISTDVLEGDEPLSQLALDGVSCTACHKIEPDGLGTPSSFSGGFEMADDKRAYGPFADVHAEPMVQDSDFEPVQGEHVRESSMCGSCHTLYTDPIDASGEPTAEGHFPEQTPFLEWRNSSYSEAGDGGPTHCQDCHEPTDGRGGGRIETQIARNKFGMDYDTENVPKRSPYGRHLFVGGNTLIPAILRDHSDALSPLASDEAFTELIDRTRRQLEHRTATVEVADAGVVDGTLRADVRVETMTGHKFPTGYPARRAWLHLRVTDADGGVVFESGAVDDRGRILADGEPLASESPGGPIPEHLERVDAPADVQIYQSVMADADGDPTYRLMRAASYAKDNRLLPRGWSSDHPDIDEMAPVGTSGDENFSAGGDVVAYRVPVDGDGASAYTVEVDLYYQPLGHRFARELFEVDTRAVRIFERYWSAADRSPEVVDSATVEVP